LGRFHRFVKPDFWANDHGLRQRYAASCFNDESKAISFSDTLADLLDWVPGLLGVDLDSVTSTDLLFVTLRDFEVQVLLPQQCDVPQPGTVDPALQSFLFCRWACLKDVFREQFALANDVAPSGLRSMLRHLGLDSRLDLRRFAMDEASCMAKVLAELLRLGWGVKATAWRNNVAAPTSYLLPRRSEGGGACRRMGVKRPVPEDGWFDHDQRGRHVEPPLMRPPSWPPDAEVDVKLAGIGEEVMVLDDEEDQSQPLIDLTEVPHAVQVLDALPPDPEVLARALFAQLQEEASLPTGQPNIWIPEPPTVVLDDPKRVMQVPSSKAAPPKIDRPSSLSKQAPHLGDNRKPQSRQPHVLELALRPSHDRSCLSFP